jgi:dsDNA-specific endonuclease/ATPase MutS2
MLNKGDKVSVLDEAINGIVMLVKDKEITIETEDGFMMTFNVNELLKVNDTSNLMDSIKRIDIDEIKKEKAIQKLVQNKRGMSNYDILTLQSETAKRHVEFAIKNRIPKIVFIHGVGEGVLKAELDFLLGRYDNIDFREANYQKYGQGATEVYIKQNSK